MKIGDKMRELRKEKGLTQQELATASGISRVTLGFYERNENAPPADVAIRIADALGVDLNTLIDWENKTKSVQIKTQEDWDAVREKHAGARQLPVLFEDAKRELKTNEIRLVPSDTKGGYAISYTSHDPVLDQIYDDLDKMNDEGRGETARLTKLIMKIPEYRKGSSRHGKEES